jgi:transposase
MRGVLLILKTEGIKPNYSELSRIYKIDRRVIKKMYEEDITKLSDSTRAKSSKLDPFEDIIKEKLALPGAKAKAVYKYLEANYSGIDIGSYSNFTIYVNNHNLKSEKKNEVHLRFETELGQQLQFDWKVDIKMYNRSNELFKFSILALTLCASRLKIYAYSDLRAEEDIIDNIIYTFKYIGGVPREMLTDIMTGIASTTRKEFTVRFNQFCKDFGTKAKMCKAYCPETKGKVESANRFLSWLVPYNYEFDTVDDLIKIIQVINEQANNEVNATTNMKPITLFNKEKEYLLPLPSKKIIESYHGTLRSVKIKDDSMFNYKSKRYSVSPKFINKTVKVKEVDNKLYVYYNNNLIEKHEMTIAPLNYKEEHYKEGLKLVLPYKSDSELDEMVKKNLLLLDNLKEGYNNE